jgi:lysyl-tRNA synthetase, class II
MATLKELRAERLRKLTELRELGLDPFTQGAHRTQTNQALVRDFAKHEGKSVDVVGRIMSIRLMGGVCFIDVVDVTGKIQVYLRKQDLTADHPGNALGFEELRLLDIGDFIEARGELTKTKAGEISVLTSQVRLLTKSLRPLPSAWDGLENIDTRYRQRYVDMIVNPKVKQIMLTRTRVIDELRRFMQGEGFVEVETPVLQPIYGGASARPFTTKHHKLDSTFYLRISDELYLKRAIVGGLEKVFEFGRDFRNEGIDRSHNPEFTMLEFYWAYADYEDLMALTERMFRQVIEQVHGSLKVQYQGTEVDFSAPFKRVTLRELVKQQTGVDIDQASREDLIREIKQRKLEVDLPPDAPKKDLLDEFYKATSREKITAPTFLLDYPEEMSPLAKRKPEEPGKVASMQLLVGGVELIKAYNELNDPQDQLARWQAEQNVLDAGESAEAQPVDYDYIRALEIGMPPTAGWGLGIDRLTAFLTDQPSIKDTIMFPTLRPEKFDPSEFAVD